MTRHQHKRKIIVTPTTTDQTLVIPINLSTGEISTELYDPDWSQGRLQRTELTKFLQPIEEIMVPYIQPKLSAFVHKFAFLPSLYMLAMLIGAGYSYAASKNYFQAYKIIRIGAGLGGCLVFGLFISSCVLDTRRASLRKSITTKVRNYITQNETLFKSKGLTWMLPEHFPFWIELWKTDDKGTCQSLLENKKSI